MNATVLHRRLLLILRPLLALAGEFVHVSAIYLGLAVLTTLGLSLALPSMRQQAQQFHLVILDSFQPDRRDYDAIDFTAMSDWFDVSNSQAIVVSPPGDAASTPDKGGKAGSKATAPDATAPDVSAADEALSEASRETDFHNFAQALQASMRDEPFTGLTKAQDHALRSYLSRKYKIASSVAGALVRTAFAMAPHYDLDPQLVLAVVAIESRFNPFVESHAGAQGLMQVMTNVHRDKLESHGGRLAVFNPVANIRVGMEILSTCIKRRGSVRGGLACYVGATGPSDGGYGAKVLAELRRMALASGVAPKL